MKKVLTPVITLILVFSMVFSVSALQYGEYSYDVYDMQVALIEAGYSEVAADGVYGPVTWSAVSAFQEANGLPVNGIADDATLAVLYSGGKSSTSTSVDKAREHYLWYRDNALVFASRQDAMKAYLEGSISFNQLTAVKIDPAVADAIQYVPEEPMTAVYYETPAYQPVPYVTDTPVSVPEPQPVVEEYPTEATVVPTPEPVVEPIIEPATEPAPVAEPVTEPVPVIEEPAIEPVPVIEEPVTEPWTAPVIETEPETPAPQPETSTEAPIPTPQPEPSTEGSAHVHSWTPVYRTVHHDAVTHTENTYDTIYHEAITHDEPIYETVHHDAVTEQIFVEDTPFVPGTEVYDGQMCQWCGAIFATEAQFSDHNWDTHDGQAGSESAVHYEGEIPATGHYENAIITPAWDEQVITGYKTVVSGL